MTKERLKELIFNISERANYFSNVGFDALANEFMNVRKILSEMQDVIKENEELHARIQVMENQARNERLESIVARNKEVFD